MTMQRKAPRGRIEIRNQGKTMPTIPKQNSTRVRFCSSISACIVRRTSTVGRKNKLYQTCSVVSDMR